MSLQAAIEALNLKTLKSILPEELSDSDRRRVEGKLKELVGAKPSDKALDPASFLRVIELVDAYQRNEDTSGFHKWYKPGTPFSLENLPKHAAFFKATADYREVLMLGGNRCGKTRGGATVAAVLATGQYPDWWEGVRFDCPTSIWAVGKTGQTTRDTVQEALMGPIGAWGTGAIPLDCIGRTTARQGIPNALDTVEIKHVSGGVSTIGFKSYDQKPQAFYGTKMHLVWLDEPCPDLVYHECLVRTMKLDREAERGPRGGRLIHTITPKEGLTRLLAQFLSSCDLLAGAERVKGLEAMMQIEGYDDDREANE